MPARAAKVAATQSRVCSSSSSSSSRLVSGESLATRIPTAALPLRAHSRAYHEPLLLVEPSNDDQVGGSLLSWFEGIAKERGMPWRKDWIDPAAEEWQGEEGAALLRSALEKRAYEVWISEIMLQQTRVATVIDYWTRWTTRWPTIQDLAAAQPDEVLSAWRGLGYYSRATRIHQAAQKVVADAELRGLLPETAFELEKQVPGVGRYTAGAISSIVFGRAEAILDGNVARVLSRQLAHRANPKAKATTDFLWGTAQRLVEAVARHTSAEGRSDRPSRWNQALMELGSTLCTPQQPRCHECPIKGTCRAYAEGEALAVRRGEMHESLAVHPQQLNEEVADIEDLCQECEPLDEISGGEAVDAASAEGSRKRKNGENQATSAQPVKKAAKQGSLLSHFSKKGNGSTAASSPFTSSNGQSVDEAAVSPSCLSTSRQLPPAALLTIQTHVKQYPLKAVKTKVREQDGIVCVVQHSTDSKRQWLLEQRPDTGLLASLWEFPTLLLPARGEAVNGKAKKKRGKTTEDDDDDDYEEEDEEPSKTSGSAFMPDDASTIEAARMFLLQRIQNQPPSLGHSDVISQGYHSTITHVFSHLKFHMHVHIFAVVEEGTSNGDRKQSASQLKRSKQEERIGPLKWRSNDQVEAESMGTGMRNVWALIKDSGGSAVKQKQLKR